MPLPLMAKRAGFRPPYTQILQEPHLLSLMLMFPNYTKGWSSLFPGMELRGSYLRPEDVLWLHESRSYSPNGTLAKSETAEAWSGGSSRCLAGCSGWYTSVATLVKSTMHCLGLNP